MKLTELRYIIALARERHFGRAAEACFVSQPTLSVAIRKLEEELGVEIFERTPGEVMLTPAGEDIVKQAHKVLAEVEQIRGIARQGDDPLAVPLRVGAIYTVGPYLFPRLISKVHRMAPQMPLLIEENYTAVLSEHLRDGRLDVIIIALPFDEPNVVTLPLYDEPFMVAMPADHPWQKYKHIPDSALNEADVFLLGSGHCFRDQVLNAFPQLAQRINQGRMQRTLEGGSLETIRHMVASGAGVTILPCSAVQSSENNLVGYRPFKSLAPSRQVALAWRKSFTRPRAIEILRQAIQSCELPCIRPLKSSRSKASK